MFGQREVVRIGILALPLAGLLTLVGLLGNYEAPDPSEDPSAAAETIESTGYFLSQLVGNVLGLTFLIFGIVALTAFLANTRVRALALVAMVLSISGTALILSVSGLAAYALPAIARAYLDGRMDAANLGGQQGARDIVLTILGSPGREVFIRVFLLYPAGFILFGVAVWRSGVLTKRSVLPLALHAPLFSSFIRPSRAGPPFWGRYCSSWGCLISADVFRQLSADKPEAEPPER